MNPICPFCDKPLVGAAAAQPGQPLVVGYGISCNGDGEGTMTDNSATPATEPLLPCDVLVAPVTIIRKGVPLSTLLLAIEHRRTQGDVEPLEAYGWNRSTPPAPPERWRSRVQRNRCDEEEARVLILKPQRKLVDARKRIYELTQAIRIVHDTFKRGRDQGFITRDKEFAIEILGRLLS